LKPKNVIGSGMPQLARSTFELSARRRELLEKMLRREEISSSSDRIVRRHEYDRIPLSFAQQRLWFIHQLQSGSQFYNIPIAFTFSGAINQPVLQQALDEIIRRHESLRTVFRQSDSQTYQQVCAPSPLAWTMVDFSDRDEHERKGAVSQLLERIAREPFDLAVGPLLRVSFVKLSESEHVLLLLTHHIVMDGWSIGLLLRELNVLYEAFSRNQNSPLPELSIQYSDYAIWQREQLQTDALTEQVRHWREQLSEAVPVLELPADRLRPPVQSYRGGRARFWISAELTADLKALSEREDVTLFMLLLAAFQVLLARYSGQDRLIVGASIANRNHPQAEELIGTFVNMLPIVGDLRSDPDFRELLRRTREVCLRSYPQQGIPFERVVEELQPERDLSRNPLFQVAFVLQNMPMPQVSLGEAHVDMLEVDTDSTPFDLVLSISELQDGCEGHLVFNRDLFEAERVQQLARHYQQVLAAVVADADVPVWRLKLLSAAEEREQVEQWNAAEREFPRESCIQELFEAQALQRPEAVAVVYGAEQLSYRELNERANQLAHYLRKRGVGPEVVVGVCQERSVDLVVSLLGILKAGGAYLPLDPAYPLERLAYLVEDAQVSLVLTEQVKLEGLPAQWQQVVSVDGEAAEIGGESKENPERQGWAENLAYVMYTSGSTGEPKGIGVTHRSVLRLVCNANYVQVNERDAVAQGATISFDASTFELWGALLNGARLVGVNRSELLTPGELGKKLRAAEVSVLFLTTALFNEVVRHEPGAFAGVKHLLFGGEQVDVGIVRKLVEGGSKPERLLHVYGPTEVTTYATWSEVQEVANDAQTIAIGRPLSNTKAYVLDARQELVPVGVVGELYLGGEGLARGYVGAAELTSERFVPHPFGQVPGARLYRTGDLVRYRRDGELEFVGRVDEQLKIRGFRIEPGEVESVLREHEQVAEAVVLGRQEESGEKRLVAYLVAAAGAAELSVTELRRYLGERLPEYMMPAGFVYLAELPLNANGKVDRALLPAPEWEQRRGEQEYVGPRTAVEEVLCEIWAEVLRVERVGVYDNFFELGGDSILSIQIVAKAQERGVRCSIQQLFQHPQIAALAEQLEIDTAGVAAAGELEPFSLLSEADRQQLPEGVMDAYPVAQLQAGMIFHSEYSPESAVYHDIFSYRLQAPLEEGALRETLRELGRRHSVLRTSFALSGYSEALQLVHEEVEVPLAVTDLSELSESEQQEVVRRAVALEKEHGFEWERAPLLRVLVHRCSAESFQLTLSFHHALLDGWSLVLLMTEFFQHYWFLLGRIKDDIGPPPPSTGFAQFLKLEREATQSAECQHYWEEKSQGVVPKLRRFRKRQSGLACSIQMQRVRADNQTTDGLKKVARAAAAPLKTVLLAAHLRVLSLLTGQTEVVSGVVWNGRPEELNSDKVIGLFLNTLPFRHQLQDGSWMQLVHDVFHQEQEELKHRRYPLAALRPNDAGALFEVAFNFTHFYPLNSLEQLPGLELEGQFSVAETNFPLLLNCNLDPATLNLEVDLVYDAECFDEEQVEAFTGYYERALKALANTPAHTYHETDLLSEREREQLLVRWNETSVDARRESCIQELFEAQALQRPEAVAVVYGTEQLSYGELNERANQLAQYLMKRGVGPEVVVGVCQERSLELVVSLLGILKAGGAYLPLDPAYPETRRAYMLSDAQARVLLTKEELAQLGDESKENPERQGWSENLAYVMYTSGSTGEPKGIGVTHRNVLRLVCGAEYVELNEQTVILQLASVSFDAATFELWGALLNGGQLVLYPGRVASATELGELVREQGVETLWLTSALYNAVVEQGVEELRGLRQLLIGGEALSESHIRRGLAALEDVELINGYGPTEVTTFSCTHRIRSSAGEEWEQGVPIGKPINNTEAYVLDERQELVPVGVVGELYLGGDGLARGYVGAADLTSERFVPHPFSQEAGARLYRTGDLVRYRRDGELEFMGRVDEQLKIRGFRIEPGEVESVLREHEQVAEAVVLGRQEESGEKRLVAYLVAAAGAVELSVTELRRYLGERLPEYMMPAGFVYLSKLPLNANGKLDRAALPALEPNSSTLDHVEPRTSLEKEVAVVCKQVLGVDRVGVYDNLFELGCNSIKATIIVSRLRETFNMKLPLHRFFDGPNLHDLTLAIAETQLGQLTVEESATVLSRLEQLSKEEVQALLD
jgi:amino acid adenylation domain-containing protein